MFMRTEPNLLSGSCSYCTRFEEKQVPVRFYVFLLLKVDHKADQALQYRTSFNAAPAPP